MISLDPIRLTVHALVVVACGSFCYSFGYQAGVTRAEDHFGQFADHRNRTLFREIQKRHASSPRPVEDM
jgi:hypothetical protein